MDGSTKKFYYLSALITFSIFLAGCSSEKSKEDVFPQASSECEDLARQNSYIAQWENGEITYVNSASREALEKDFVIPNLQALKKVEHDFTLERQTVKSHSIVESDYGFIDNWGVQVIEAPAAWQQGQRGSGIVVGVIDSGVDTTHPALANNIYKNPGETGIDGSGNNKASNGIDDDGNGFVDDYSGWDFVMESADVTDDDSHGTHVSGTIAASHNDTVHKTGYVQGIAPAAKIMPLDFITGTSGYVSDAIEAIQYASMMSVNIINASWGGPACSSILEETIGGLAQRNVLFVAASGNDGVNIDQYKRYPAAYAFAHQITVGMIGTTLMMANRSNYGDKGVYIFAPGTDIYSTIPGNGVAAYSGTSMATPAVVGAAALIWGSQPGLTATQVKSVLGSSTDFSSSYRNQTRGRVNVRKALSLL
jgi:subtilisin family serine protease